MHKVLEYLAKGAYSMWKCLKCGELLNDTYDICWKCGTDKIDKTLSQKSESSSIHPKPREKLKNCRKKENVSLEKKLRNYQKKIKTDGVLQNDKTSAGAGCGCLLFLLIFIITVFSYIFNITKDDRPSSSRNSALLSSRSNSLSSSSTHHVKKDYLAAYTKAGLDNITQCAGDVEAIRKLLVTGQAFSLIKMVGKEVEVVRSDWGAVEIRPRGETYTIWTYIEAID
jgi:predicted  nucleic acid-binding Zn-ribbon protein